jgi:hypothetical protein
MDFVTKMISRTGYDWSLVSHQDLNFFWLFRRIRIIWLFFETWISCAFRKELNWLVLLLDPDFLLV